MKKEVDGSCRKVRAGTGMSTAPEAARAGREAARAALAVLCEEPPALVMVFTTPRYNLAELLAGIRSVTGSAILIGATGSGQIVMGSLMGFGEGVGVLALTAGEYRFGIASAANICGDLDRAGQEIARASLAAAGPTPYAAVMLLADCLAGDLQELVKGIYRITGPKVPLVGGAAGDELKFLKTFVFHNDTVIENGAVALWIGSGKPLRVITRHGFEPIGIPMLVTRVEGTEIIEIGGRPAALAYEEQLGLTPGELSSERFWDTSILHPLGILQHDGASVIRVARAKTGDGRLKINGCVPPAGSGVQVMSGNADTLLDILEEVAGAALGVDSDAAALLVFSCAARKVIFGDRASEEARRLQAAAGQIPVFGLYCCGEFARSVGVSGAHNATLTALAL
ncbi:MAG: FIST N-terminal domain-containing protein [Syntrophobacteraceae bacterium]|nr:FIST N-terminal domain-containing protein [Syntrophobacteraceae bacterium]